MERRLTTIVAADVVGYSRLMAADEEGTIQRFRTLKTEVIDPEISKAGGRLIKTMGDGLLIEFPSPVAALRAAIAVQDFVIKNETAKPAELRMQFRVGINLGDVVIDGDDILGEGVNIAARLESLASPGGICMSRSVYDQVKSKTDASLIALGPQQVKNIPHPIEVWQIGGDARIAQDKGSDRPSIAILPFDNLSSDPDQAFLADGIVEDVTTELSRFRTLDVIARNSAFAYRGKSTDIRQIAAELDARYVVEGSVRRAGNRLRVTAQLIEAATGSQLWAERWDRTLDDLFDVQDELTSAIVSGVEPELGAHERAVVRRKPTENLTAWELCQKGYYEFTKYTDESYASAFELYQLAVAADPDFALPHAYLGRWYWVQIVTGRTKDVAADVKTGIDHAQTAVALDNRLELGYASLGVLSAIAGYEEDAVAALDAGERMNGHNAVLQFARTHVCLYQKEPDTAAMERAARLAIKLSPKDPLAWGFWFNLGNAYMLRDFDISDAMAGEMFEKSCRFPNSDFMTFLAAAFHSAAVGKKDAASRYLETAMLRKPGLTAEKWRSLFPFPTFPKYVEACESALQILIELGLPES